MKVNIYVALQQQDLWTLLVEQSLLHNNREDLVVDEDIRCSMEYDLIANKA